MSLEINPSEKDTNENFAVPMNTSEATNIEKAPPTNVILFSVQTDTECLGLKFVHYFLLKKGKKSTIVYLPRLNITSDENRESLKEFIENKKPDLFGISLMSHEVNNATKLTNYLKNNFPEVPVIWGGIHPTMAPDSSLDDADYICVGEGEHAMAQLCDILETDGDIETVSNLRFMKEGEKISNPMFPLMTDLDQVPAYDHIPLNSFVQHNSAILPMNRKLYARYAPYLGKTYSVLTTRGCPYACTFCCNDVLQDLYNDRSLRYRSLEHVIEELERAVKDNPGLCLINFQDDCFLSGRADKLKKFFDEYNKRVGLPFVCHAIPTYVTDEKMAILKEAKIAWIIVGLQSGSDRVLREVYQRKSLTKHFLKAATVIKKYDVAGIYDVIVDNPLETEEETIETIEVLLQTPKPFMPEIFSMTLYAGTEIHRMATEANKVQEVEDYRVKNYLVYKKSILNHIVRLAIFVNKGLVKQLLDMYKTNPKSPVFLSYLLFLRIISAFVIEPVTIFRMVVLSQGGSVIRALQTLPIYVRQGGQRFLDQF